MNVFAEARTSEILCKPIQIQYHRLTIAWSAAYPQFISGTASAVRSCLFVSVKPFMQGMSRNRMREQNERLTSGLRLVYPRLIEGQKALSVRGCVPVERSPFVFCKPIICKACLGFFSKQQTLLCQRLVRSRRPWTIILVRLGLCFWFLKCYFCRSRKYSHLNSQTCRSQNIEKQKLHFFDKLISGPLAGSQPAKTSREPVVPTTYKAGFASFSMPNSCVH